VTEFDSDEDENDQDSQDELNIDLEPGFQCGTHGKLIHSYILSNNVLLCSKCIEEQKLEKDKYRPIQQVIKQVHRYLIDQNYSKELCLIQLSEFKSSLQYEIEQQKDRCRGKIEEYFKKLHEIVRKEELKSYQNLEKQHNAILEKALETSKVEYLEEKIKRHKKKIEGYFAKNDDVLLNEYDKIKRVANHKNKYFKKMVFPTKQVCFRSKDNLLDRIKDMVQKSWELDITSSQPKEYKEKIKD